MDGEHDYTSTDHEQEVDRAQQVLDATKADVEMRGRHFAGRLDSSSRAQVHSRIGRAFTVDVAPTVDADADARYQPAADQLTERYLASR